MKGSRCTMSNKENEKFDDNLSSTEKPREAFRDDPLADTSRLISQEVPPGVDRRNFLIRSAVGGAAAVMTGRLVSAEERTAMAIATLPPQAKGAKGERGAPLCRPGCREEGEGARADDGGRVLQGGARTFQLAHDRSDAHHLRFLPASHQAAGRQTRQGDGAQGQPVRKPQRHRKGTRHGTGRAGGTGRERAGNRRPEISGRPARQA